MKNGLSVDVEDYFHAEAITGHIGRNDWGTLQSRVVKNTYRVLDLLSEHNVQATFFVLGWVADHFPHLVTEIHSRGHEIGCHSYWHRLIYELTSEEFREDTRRAKDAIESAVGVEIIGYRAPSFSLTERSLWALEILQELGFQYDSSIFPTYHDLYGFPGHPRFLCHHGRDSKWNIVEFPISTWRVGLLNLPFGGGGYLRILPLTYTHLAFRRVNEHDRQPVIVYFHPWEIDPEQPRFEIPFRSRFRHYTNLDKMRMRVEALLQSYEFVSLCELLELDQHRIPMEYSK
ncbi:MAG: polysaccharide deacetylase family protein [Acidobacteria bacterium]|nr:MAG: polysaccharide deacetylase family protein [Acidobacteriota bacterium]